MKEGASIFNLSFHIPKIKKLNMHIRHMILLEYNNNENATNQFRKVIVFMANVSLLITKSEIGHKNVLIVIHE